MNKLIILITALLIATMPLQSWAEEEQVASIKIEVESDNKNVINDERLEALVKIARDIDKDLVKIEVEGLSDEEKEKLIMRLEGDLEDAITNVVEEHIPPGAIALGALAIIMVFGLPIFIVVALLIYGMRRRKQKMELVNAYLAAGQEVPEHVLQSFDAGKDSNTFRSGVMWTAVGIGIVAAFGGDDVGAIGFIPMFVGLGRLIFWYFSDRKQNQALDHSQQD